MESIGADLEEMKRVPLSDSHVDAIRGISEEVTYKKGEMVAEVGDPMDRFVYVLDGEIEVVDAFSGERLLESSLGPTQFMGELAFLNAGSYTLPMRAAKDTVTLEAPREKMLDLMSKVPELSDHVITVFSARRRKQYEDGRSAIKLVGADRDSAVRAVASFLSRNRIPFQSYDLEGEGEDERRLCNLVDNEPSVVLGAERIVDDPTPRKVARLLGLDLNVCTKEDVDVLIVGGGPAGVAAAVYAGSEGLDALVIEDTAIGGQAGTSSRIENYMGFPTGISGADLVYRGQVQAMKFGTRFVMPRRVEGMKQRENGTFCATLDDGDEICAKAVLVSTGVQYRKLPIERLDDFEGAGIYYAATDMEARFCAGRNAVVIGGGNSAGQAAMYLSRVAKCVHLMVRGDSLADSMSSYLSERLEADSSIAIHYNHEVKGLDGDEMLRSVCVEGPDGERQIDCGGLFIMIGAAPNTEWLSGLVELDDKGFVLCGEDVDKPMFAQTSCDGIWAVGDVRATSVKRVASAVGEGSVVVSDIWRHVAAQNEAMQNDPPGSQDD